MWNGSFGRLCWVYPCATKCPVKQIETKASAWEPKVSYDVLSFNINIFDTLKRGNSSVSFSCRYTESIDDLRALYDKKERKILTKRQTYAALREKLNVHSILCSRNLCWDLLFSYVALLLCMLLLIISFCPFSGEMHSNIAICLVFIKEKCCGKKKVGSR